MKIQKIRFKNLNSLVGEWEIDLTHADFTSSGIFAITGPTGAGKTTILDAICLALYGQTPRLADVNDGKAGNEIMSRRTGECFAEVTFETKSGRFRCHWSQKRSQKKSGGKLKKQTHEIASDETGEILESQVSKVVGRVEEVTGLNFDRFTRSMLLAQGRFDGFLKAKASERSPILEQLTGTEIYSRISRKVHERQRDEQNTLNSLKEKMAGTVTLSAEDEERHRLELATKQQDEGKLAAKSAGTKKAIDWLNKVAAINEDISKLDAEAINLQSEVDAFVPEREKLLMGEKAASLDALYATLTGLRHQHVAEQAALKVSEENLPVLTASAGEAAKTLDSAEKQTASAKEEKKKEESIIQKVRIIDERLAGQKEAISETKKSCQNDAEKIETDQKSLKKETQKRTHAGKEQGQANDYLEEQKKDAWLVGGFAGVEVQLDNLRDKCQEIAEKEVTHNKAVAALNKCQKLCVTLKKKLDDASSILQQKEALRQWGDKTSLRAIANLEEQRTQLEDGKPCPLCGATEHPLAVGNVPSRLEVEEYEAELTNFTEIEKQTIRADAEKESAGKTLDDVKASQEKLVSDFNALNLSVLTKLQPLGIAEIADSDVASLKESLQKRLQEWQTHVQEKEEIAKQITTLDGDIKSLGAVIKTQSDALAEKREKLNNDNREYHAERERRKELYGDKTPDTEVERLDVAVVSFEAAASAARKLRDERQQELTTASAQIASLQKRITELTASLNDSELQFSAALSLSPASFAGEQQFCDARLTETERTYLSAKEKELAGREAGLKARQQDCIARLQETTSQKVTEQTLGELEPQLKESEMAREQLRSDIASIDVRLRDHAAAKERLKNQQAAIDAQEREWRRWNLLHERIGSADGKKYRDFAQGLTFEMMIDHANRQLENITSRYQLLRDADQPLELCVRDDEQDGEVRPTKNLSGGESFIVSLALALGLSHMASENVSVDSLFLDEGFGTLDAETLDDALRALTGLQRDNKLIGIISHVDALKEQISTQIEVKPYTGGRSRLTGPGCAEIKKGKVN